MNQIEISEAVITGTREQEDKRKELAQQEFAQEARRLREKAGLSQKQLGILMGIEQAIISRIELANYGITLDVVLRYANFFHEDPHRLASVYWGSGENESSDINKKVLDSVWEMLSAHYQPKVKELPPPPQGQVRAPHQLPPYQEDAQEIAGKEEGLKVQRARSAARKRASQKKNQPKDSE